MLMALRFVSARLCFVGGLLIVLAATTATTMSTVAVQMHADKQGEKYNPYPVLR